MSEATNKVIVKINDVATGTEYTTINDALAAIKADATVDAKYTVELNGVFAEAIKLDSYNDTAWNGGKNIAFVKAADAEIAAVTGAVTVGYTASPGNKAAEFSWRGDVEFNGITFDYTAATDNANRFEILYIGKANKLTVKDCAFNGPGMINAGYNAGDPSNNNGDPNGDNAGNLFCTPWKAATDYAQGALSVEGCTFTNGNINFWRNSYNWDFSGCKFENAPVTFLGSPCPEGWTFADCTYSMNLDNVPEGVAAYLVSVSENAKLIDLSGATMTMSGNAEGKDASYILSIAPNSDSNTTKASIIVDGAVVQQVVKETYIEGEGESAVEVTKDVVKDGVLGGADFLVNKSPAETVPGKYTCTTVGSSFTGNDVSGVTIEDIAGAANVSITNTDANGNQNQIVTNGEGAVENIVTGNVLFTADETLDGTNTINGVAKVVDGATLTINDSYKGANLAAGEDNYFDFGNGDEAAVGGTIDINGDVKINQINADASGIVNVNEGAVLDSAEICIENGSVEGAVAGVMNVAGTVETASMRIFNGGTVNVAAGAEVIGDHGDNVASMQNISVWGEGSALNINGGAVSAAESMSIGEGSALNINGGSLDVASTLTNAGTIKVNGKNTLDIANYSGNTIVVEGGELANTSIIGDAVAFTGDTQITGDANFSKIWVSGGTVTIADSLTTKVPYAGFFVVGGAEKLNEHEKGFYKGFSSNEAGKLVIDGEYYAEEGAVSNGGELVVNGTMSVNCLYGRAGSVQVNKDAVLKDIVWGGVDSGVALSVAGGSLSTRLADGQDAFSIAGTAAATDGAVLDFANLNVSGELTINGSSLTAAAITNTGIIKVTGEAASTINATVTGDVSIADGVLGEDTDLTVTGKLFADSGKNTINGGDYTLGGLVVGTDVLGEEIASSATLEISGATVAVNDNGLPSVWVGREIPEEVAEEGAVKDEYKLVLKNGTVVGRDGAKLGVEQVTVRDNGSLEITEGSQLSALMSYVYGNATVTGENSLLTVHRASIYGNVTVADNAKLNTHLINQDRRNITIMDGAKLDVNGGIVEIDAANATKGGAACYIQVKAGGEMALSNGATVTVGKLTADDYWKFEAPNYIQVDKDGLASVTTGATLIAATLNNSGTVELTGGKLVAGEVDNQNIIKVTGEAGSTINATVKGNAVALEGTLKDSAIVGNLKVYGKDAVIEDSTFGNLYVGIDNTFTKEGYFEAGYSDVENAVTLKGDINAGIIYAGCKDKEAGALNTVVIDEGAKVVTGGLYAMATGKIEINSAESVTVGTGSAMISGELVINNSDAVIFKQGLYSNPNGSVTIKDSVAVQGAESIESKANNAEITGIFGSFSVENSKFKGNQITVYENGSMNVVDSDVIVDYVYSDSSTLTVNKGGALIIDAASTLTAGSINNAGTITIDASGIEEGLWQQVVEVDTFTGNAYEFINVSGNIGYTVAEDGDVWLYNIARDTVYVNKAWDAGYELGDAIEGSEGLYFGINAFASIDLAVTEAANFPAISKIEVVKGSDAGLHVDVTTTNESGLVVNMGNNGLSFDKNGAYTVNGLTDFDYSTAVGAEIGFCPNELTIGKNTEVTADVLWANDNTRNIDGVLNVNGVYVRDNEVNVNGTLNVADNYYTSWGAELNVNAEGKFTALNVYNNNGSVINVNGDAEVGVIENDSTSVVNVAGTINGAVNNNNVVNVAGTINGAVVNNADLNLNANSAVTGEITGEKTSTIYVKDGAEFTTAKDMTAGLIYVGMDAEGAESTAKLTVAEGTTVTAVDNFYLRNTASTVVEGTILAGGYNVQGDMDVTGKMVANPSIFDLSIYKGGDLNLDGATLEINIGASAQGDASMITVGKDTAGKLVLNNSAIEFNTVEAGDTLGITVSENGVVEFNDSSAAFDTVANNGSFTVSGDVNLNIVEFSGKAISVAAGAAITGDINADLVLGGAVSYDGAFAGIITGNGSIAATGSLNLMEGSAVDTVTINGQVSEFSDSLYGLKNLVGEAGTELFINSDAFKSGTAVSNIVLNIAGLALVDDFVVKADVDTLANVKTINGVDVQHMNGRYFVDYDGISYELFDKNNGELLFDEIVVEEGKAPVTESTDTNTSLEGNVNTNVAIETKEGNTNVKVEKDADITVGGIYKQNGAGTNNVALSKNSSLTVNGDIEELGKLTTAVNSTLIVNGNVGGTDLANSINITKGMMAYFESIDLGEGKDTFSIGAGAKVQVKEDVERVETIKLANGNANARSVLTIGGEISGFNAKGSITVGNYAVLVVEDGLDYEGTNLGVTIKTGNYSITEFGGDLKTATISTGKYSEFTAENIIATTGNDTMSFGAYADVKIANVDMGSGKKDTIKIGNNADVTIGAVSKVTDIKIGKDADVSFGNISYDAEAKKNTFDLGADADLKTGSITNVTDLKVGKGAEADFGAVNFTGDKASLDIANDAVVSFDEINEAALAKVKFGKGAVITKNGDWDLADAKGSWDKATLISAFDVDETALDDAFVGQLYANEVAEFTFDVAQGQDLGLAFAEDSEGFKAELYADSNPYNPLLVWEDLAAGQYTLRVSVADTDSLDKGDDLEYKYSFKATLA